VAAHPAIGIVLKTTGRDLTLHGALTKCNSAWMVKLVGTLTSWTTLCLCFQAVQDILIRGGLLQKVADRKLALMVCMSDHNPHTYNDYLNDDKWAKDVERVWQHKEEQWRVFLQAQLAMKGTWREEGELEEFMEGLQVVTMRAVGFKALLGAWASGRLEGTDATQLGKLLQRTGATAYYSSLMRMLKWVSLYWVGEGPVPIRQLCETATC
jgi:hypothetical protein